jgi:type II secretory pathway pseudopilin PulG
MPVAPMAFQHRHLRAPTIPAKCANSAIRFPSLTEILMPSCLARSVFKLAFTLIEVLVSTAIIFILVGLMVLTASTSIREAKAASDAQSLRQIGMAREMYTADHGDGLPSFIFANLVPYTKGKGIWRSKFESSDPLLSEALRSQFELEGSETSEMMKVWIPTIPSSFLVHRWQIIEDPDQRFPIEEEDEKGTDHMCAWAYSPHLGKCKDSRPCMFERFGRAQLLFKDTRVTTRPFRSSVVYLAPWHRVETFKPEMTLCPTKPLSEF